MVELSAWLREHALFGIPGDFWAHLAVGGIFYFYSRIYCSDKTALILVLSLALSKEVFDLSAIILSEMYFEPLKDIMVTIAIPLLAMIGAAKKRHESLQT